ncbi:unnamed protein product [Sphenostylis stenocarpa]|uniref:Uncharacterized protein n=1 Tax=Sphenostylis stenocarpa TaxID=92480 RepID=A0AA86SA56_9FABA|nr:unnamed protein product [Sphenostylis stenocarpa]
MAASCFRPLHFQTKETTLTESVGSSQCMNSHRVAQLQRISRRAAILVRRWRKLRRVLTLRSRYLHRLPTDGAWDYKQSFE